MYYIVLEISIDECFLERLLLSQQIIPAVAKESLISNDATPD